MDYHREGAPIPSLRPLSHRQPGDWGGLGEGVLVGVVDTGMRAHPWLDGGYLAAPDDFEPFDLAWRLERKAEPLAGHGTFVSGLILQQAPSAAVWVERALASNGAGLASEVANAATTLAQRGVRVLNLSLGCFEDDPAARTIMQEMVTDLHRINPDLLIVAAAGNIREPGEPDDPADFWPAKLDGVTSVGAVDLDADGRYRWAPWSNRGSWIDLAARGTNLLSTYLYGRAPGRVDGKEQLTEFQGWARWSGTSMAAAVASGVIAAQLTHASADQALKTVLAGNVSQGWVAEANESARVPVLEPAAWPQLLPDGRGPAPSGPAAASA